MFISKREYIEEVYVVLKLGVDFEREDIDNRGLPSLRSNKAAELAIDNGYLKWSWLGDFDEKTGTVTAKFQRPIFVDEDNKQVIIRG